MMMVQKITISQSIAGWSASFRDLARCSSSAASPVSASTMSCTPSLLPSAKLRQHRGADDDVGNCVGDDRLEPAANLDAHFVFCRRDDEQHAVIQLFGADAPMPAELIAVILDGVALQRMHGDDDDLVGALVFERLELGGERRLVTGAE